MTEDTVQDAHARMTAVADRNGERRRRRDFRAIVTDGVAFSVMVGAGETYVPAFALAIGVGQVLAGWLAAIPVLAGAVLQLVSPTAVRRLGSHRRWVVLCAVLQAAALLGYAACAWRGWGPAWALMLIATAYWGAGLATGPAWNTWVGTLVPARLRARFFARRSRIAQAAVVAGFVGGGLALQWSSTAGVVLDCFTILFIVAAAARIVSATALWSQSEPSPTSTLHRRVGVLDWIRRVRHGRDGRLLAYLLAVQLAVQIAAPFFTPYMLVQAKFSYGQYLALLSISFVTKMLALPVLGAIAHRWGAPRLLTVAGFGIVPLAGLWMVSDNLAFLACVQLLSGPIWAAYELTTFLLLFDHIDESERTSVLTTYNLANAVAMVSGALLGGLVLHALHADVGAYRAVFGLSTLGRAAAVILLLRLHATIPEPMRFVPRVVGVRPNTGSLDTPMTAAIEAPDDASRPAEDDRATPGRSPG